MAGHRDMGLAAPLRRRWWLPTIVGVSMALAAGTADAAPVTVTFSAPGEHVFTVPDGVTRVDVVAIGGLGGRTVRRGGRAGQVNDTLGVTPGQNLYAEVGSNASGSTPGANGGGGAGGAAAQCQSTPGAGGGASDVRTVALGQPGSAASRVLVAGGGGGAATLGSSGGDAQQVLALSGGHRGTGGGGAALGGYGGADGVGGAGQNGSESGTDTTGGHGGVGVAGQGSGCGGGGGGGYGGGGAGSAGPAGGAGGGGGGGGSLVPDAMPPGMAPLDATPSVTFTTPGQPAPSGPLAITSEETFRQSPQFGGKDACQFCNCPATCQWADGSQRTPETTPGDFQSGDVLWANEQLWGAGALVDGNFGQAFVAVQPALPGTPATPGQPFRLSDFAHYNEPIRRDSPSALNLQALLTVQPPAGSPVVFQLLGPDAIPLDFEETVNETPCDPSIQVSSTPCDDLFNLPSVTRFVAASGLVWRFDLLGFRQPDGTIAPRFVSQEDNVDRSAFYGEITTTSHTTTSSLAVGGDNPAAPTLTLTTTPVPQTGGTVTFTDGGAPIAGCTEIPVGASDGVTTCTPAGLSAGTHTFGGEFAGGVGYGASSAAPVTLAPPETTITAGPAGATSDSSPSFSFSSDRTGATFECELDGPGATSGSYGSCTSPKAYTDLADGTYTFSVRASDGAGNTDASPAVRSFTIDTAGPSISIVTPKAGARYGRFTKVKADYSCADEAGGSGVDSCVGPVPDGQTIDTSRVGRHAFTVTATDRAGNRRSTTVHYKIKPCTITLPLGQGGAARRIDFGPVSICLVPAGAGASRVGHAAAL